MGFLNLPALSLMSVGRGGVDGYVEGVRAHDRGPERAVPNFSLIS